MNTPDTHTIREELIVETLHEARKAFHTASKKKKAQTLKRVLEEFGDDFEQAMGSSKTARKARDRVVIAAKAYVIGEWDAKRTAEFIDKVLFLQAHEEVESEHNPSTPPQEH